MMDNIFIELDMLVYNNVHLQFLCFSNVIQFLKMVKYLSEIRITQTTFNCVVWYKNKTRIIISKKIWARPGQVFFLPRW